jgi:hypothetical protein
MKRSMVVAAALLASSSAYAHFKLNAPASMSVQSAAGSPQKNAPCGLSDTAGMADTSTKTNAVTVLQSGTMLAVKLNETVFHSGHYRVAIAQDLASLPADPTVTGAMCGSAAIMATPTMPVLADGLLQHTTDLGMNNEQTLMVPIPAGFECTNCVLQVIQFMSNHVVNNPGGCYYHHCATVTVQSAPPPVDGPPTTNPGVDAGADPNNPDSKLEGGCCSANGGPTTSILGAALMALLVLRKRRARS